MAIKDVVKVTRKTFLNPRAWLGYDSLKSQTIFLWQFFKQVFGPAFKPLPAESKNKQAESFSAVMARLNLSEEDIVETGKLYFVLAGVFVLSAIGVLVLFIQYLLAGHWAATFVSLGVIVFLLAQGFRYHFWYFQIKHRKLGCTFEEWYQGKISSGDDHHA